MLKDKLFVAFAWCCAVAMPMAGQNQKAAKILFDQQKYAEALPAYEKFVKQNPSNAQMNYYLGTCLYYTDNQVRAEGYLKKAADRGVADAGRCLGKLYADWYCFDEADKYYSQFLKSRKKQTNEVYEKEYDQIKRAAIMLKGTEKVQFIDSVVVDKASFLKAYRISPESGVLMPTQDIFSGEAGREGVLYQSELGNRIWFASAKEGEMALYSSDKLDGEWSEPQLLKGLPEGDVMNCPYVLSDGVTLYYAAKGEGSLGGYDIFVTRLNTETNRYLKPENIGMPFNSPANDYMYVVDEYNNLGWFATDRNQSDDKVCIYVFIPNKSREIYDYENISTSEISDAARLVSIKASQTDKDAVLKARQRLAMIRQQIGLQKKKYDFTFIVDDTKVCHYLTDFSSSRARALFQQWQKDVAEYARLENYLQKRRDEYAAGNASVKNGLKAEILSVEQHLEKMQSDLDRKEMDIRNEELKRNR